MGVVCLSKPIVVTPEFIRFPNFVSCRSRIMVIFSETLNEINWGFLYVWDQQAAPQITFGDSESFWGFSIYFAYKKASENNTAFFLCVGLSSVQ